MDESHDEPNHSQAAPSPKLPHRFTVPAFELRRLLEAMLDLEGAGDDAKGVAERAGHGLSGAAHLFLGYTALELALGTPTGAGDGETARAATSWLLTLPAGSVSLTTHTCAASVPGAMVYASANGTV